MDSTSEENEQALIKDRIKLYAYLGNGIDEITQLLNDEKLFCNKDIDESINYIEIMDRKFHEKIQELKSKLEEIRRKNEQITAENNKRFEFETAKIDHLYKTQKDQEALDTFRNYQKIVHQRPTLLSDIPKLLINEHDIEQFFSLDKPLPIQSTVIATVARPTLIIDDDKQDDIKISNKQRLRQEKVIESHTGDNDDEKIDNDKNEQDFDRSKFGFRSRREENQPATTIISTMNTGTKSSTTPVPVRPPFRFSTRLDPRPGSTNGSFSPRNIGASLPSQNSNIVSRNHHEQVRFTPTPPNIVSSPTQQLTPSDQNSQIRTLPLNPVSHYQYEQKFFHLMACNARFIVIFKSQLNRLDRWHLGTIERGTQAENKLDWHEGLIISMGLIEKNNIYIFTEYEFFIYSITQRRKLLSRILPRGNDEGSDLSSIPYNDSQRGIGAVYNKYMYHIYLNRNSRWTLSKNILETLAHIYDYDLALIFPEVERFLHFCVNDKTINFLVQLYNSSYAVVFCLAHDCNINGYQSTIILLHAQQPLTICSAYIPSKNKYYFFINDPSNDILHMISTEKYLQSYPIKVHAICYVADKHELMVVTNNSICSVNLNDTNSIF